jgi:hypothetical protein
LSDHRYIVFQVGNLEVTRLTYRNPKRTNWESYQEDLKVNLGVVPRVIHSVRGGELAVDLLQQAILLSYHKTVATLKLQQDSFLIKLIGQVTVNHILVRQPLPVTTKRLEKPNSSLGGSIVRGSRMYLTGPDS